MLQSSPLKRNLKRYKNRITAKKGQKNKTLAYRSSPNDSIRALIDTLLSIKTVSNVHIY